MKDGRSLSRAQTNFLNHELTEADLVSNNVSQEMAHEFALTVHDLFSNYSPEVIKQYSEYFNSNWVEYWEKQQG